MINYLSRPRTISQRLALVGAIVLVTLVAFGLAFWARQARPEIPPLSWEEVTAFEYDPYLIGYLFQGIVVPVVLIYLFSTTKLFRRISGGEAGRRDSPKLFLALALIQLLVLTFDLWRVVSGGEPGAAVLGLLVIVTGGLLGGWPVGLSLGLIAMLFRGTQDTAIFMSQGMGQELMRMIKMEGLQAVLGWPDWRPVLMFNYLYNFWAGSAVWAGIVAGLWAALLGERRFAPLAALGLGVGMDLGAGLLTTVAGNPPAIVFLVPSILVSGVATVAVVLMVRNVQADSARRKAEAAELAATRAELRALRAQINPHFLFNALNTIRYFVRTDSEAARRLLLDLSEVFQRALRSGEFVPLQDEMSYVQAYLSLEQARLGDRLQVEWLWNGEAEEGEDESLREQPVPTLILQPIVENAVLHGIAKKTGGGMVRVSAGKRDGTLLLRVGDNGPGMTPERLAEILSAEQQESKSIGLRNVDGRLRALYGEEYGLVIKSKPGQGTSVLIRIPLEG